MVLGDFNLSMSLLWRSFWIPDWCLWVLSMAHHIATLRRGKKHFTVGSEVGMGNGIQQILAHLELNVEIPALAGGLEARIYQILQTW